jgi:class 3 adenylate cyclase
MSETRKLVAILVADVVGYSRLAGADEDHTLERLRLLRNDLIDPAITSYHVPQRRIVKCGVQGFSFGKQRFPRCRHDRIAKSVRAGISVPDHQPPVLDGSQPVTEDLINRPAPILGRGALVTLHPRRQVGGARPNARLTAEFSRSPRRNGAGGRAVAPAVATASRARIRATRTPKLRRCRLQSRQ